MKNALKRIRTFRAALTAFTRKIYKTITRALLTRPEVSVFTVLGAIFLLIIAGSVLGKLKTSQVKQEVPVKHVSAYGVGTAPRIRVSGTVETSGSIKVVAQTPGVVQSVNVTEGDRVSRGQNLAWLSTNYQGGTLPSVTRQIAQKNYEFALSNYDAQADIIKKQRELADQANQQAGDMRAISDHSIGQTQDLVDLDTDIVRSINDQIASLEASNVGGANDALILQAKQGKAAAEAGLNSLKVALETTRYQANGDNAPAKMAGTQHDIAVAQLDLQQKSLDLNKELAGLNLRVAQISESLMYPVSPVSGIVERVFVHPGETVNPGTAIASIAGDSKTSSVVVLIPAETARSISRLEPSKITVGSVSDSLYPRYISTQPTSGVLYSAIYTVPDTLASLVTNGGSVIVELPIGAEGTTAAIPYVPLDALYQTQTESYVYVATASGKNQQTAESRKVSAGTVYGRYVEIPEGLRPGDLVITTRNVVTGDRVVTP